MLVVTVISNHTLLLSSDVGGGRREEGGGGKSEEGGGGKSEEGEENNLHGDLI